MSVCTPDLTTRLTEAMRQYRREGARLAAMILFADPERVDEPIVDFLRHIEYVHDEQVAHWISRAGAHPLTPGAELSVTQRRIIAGQLVTFSKGQS